jgi:hypothetical protein
MKKSTFTVSIENNEFTDIQARSRKRAVIKAARRFFGKRGFRVRKVPKVKGYYVLLGKDGKVYDRLVRVVRRPVK